MTHIVRQLRAIPAINAAHARAPAPRVPGPTQLRTRHITALVRDGATEQERLAVVAALLAGLPFRIVPEGTDP